MGARGWQVGLDGGLDLGLRRDRTGAARYRCCRDRRCCGTGARGRRGSGRAARRPGRGRASSPEILVIVCAGVVLASLDLFIVNVALPAIARDLGSRSLSDLSWVLNGYAIVYAALLVPAAARRPAPADVRVPARRRRLHRGVRGVRRGDQRRHADRLPAGAGGRRGAADPHLAEHRARLLSATAAQRRGPRVDRDRRRSRRVRTGDRRLARRGQLAVGVPGQRADRDRGPGGRLAPAAGRARPSGPASRPAGRHPGHGRGGRSHPGPDARRRLGLGIGPDGLRS